MSKITIDNRDLENVHIDTYQMLTGESADEMTREYEKENGNEKHEMCDIDYNMPDIVKGLARESINIILQGIKYENGGDCITNITYVSSTSPKFYNYTTDSYVMAVDVDDAKLEAYLADNIEAVGDVAKKYDDTTINGGIMSRESLLHAAICHIINNAITADDYNMAIWEVETTVYYENMTVTA